MFIFHTTCVLNICLHFVTYIALFVLYMQVLDNMKRVIELNKLQCNVSYCDINLLNKNTYITILYFLCLNKGCKI